MNDIQKKLLTVLLMEVNSEHDSDKRVFHIDQLEWYIVCCDCYYSNKEYQWSGSTRAFNWRDYQKNTIAPTLKNATHCEFCKKLFGAPANKDSGRDRYSLRD